MYALDVPRTQLLVSSIIATIAILGNLVSITMVAWQIRHRNSLETKKLEQEQLAGLLAALDKPYDMALFNIQDVEYLRNTNPASLDTAESLHQRRPTLVTDFRAAYQEFTNVASTLITVLPACRNKRFRKHEIDDDMEALEKLLEKLVDAYNALGQRYANTAQLINLRLHDWGGDPIQRDCLEKLIAARDAASEFLADLYA